MLLRHEFLDFGPHAGCRPSPCGRLVERRISRCALGAVGGFVAVGRFLRACPFVLALQFCCRHQTAFFEPVFQNGFGYEDILEENLRALAVAMIGKRRESLAGLVKEHVCETLRRFHRQCPRLVQKVSYRFSVAVRADERAIVGGKYLGIECRTECGGRNGHCLFLAKLCSRIARWHEFLIRGIERAREEVTDEKMQNFLSAWQTVDAVDKFCHLAEAEEAVFVVCGYSEPSDRFSLLLAKDV